MFTKQARSQNFTWGAHEGAIFSLKKLTFFSHRHQRSPYFWHILGPCNTSAGQNSLTLLNKAGPTSQQTKFFP